MQDCFKQLLRTLIDSSRLRSVAKYTGWDRLKWSDFKFIYLFVHPFQIPTERKGKQKQ